MSDSVQGWTGSPPVAPGGSWVAGWYRDPWFDGQQRYWDGTAWTPHVQPHAQVHDPYAPPWASAPGTGSTGTGSTGWLSTDHLSSPPPSGRRRGFVVVLSLVLVAALAAAITIASNSGTKRRTVAPIPPLTVPSGPSSPSTTSPPAVSSDPSASVLTQLVVTQADVPSADVVGLIPGGNMVTGQVTLDLCNGTYASEALRTARRQVDVADPTGQTLFSTEAVLYHNAASTTQAFTELQARAANCPQQLLPPPPGEAGLPNTKTTFNAKPDGSWPNTPSVDRLAYDFTSTDQQGTATHSIAVYVRRGRVLMGLYFANPDQAQAAVSGQTTVPGIVTVFEKRIAALPSSVVNATVAVSAPAGSI